MKEEDWDGEADDEVESFDATDESAELEADEDSDRKADRHCDQEAVESHLDRLPD